MQGRFAAPRRPAIRASGRPFGAHRLRSVTRQRAQVAVHDRERHVERRVDYAAIRARGHDHSRAQGIAALRKVIGEPVQRAQRMPVGVLAVAGHQRFVTVAHGDRERLQGPLERIADHGTDKQAAIRDAVRKQFGKSGGGRVGVARAHELEHEPHLAQRAAHVLFAVGRRARGQVARQHEGDLGLDFRRVAVGDDAAGRIPDDRGRENRRARDRTRSGRHRALPAANRLADEFSHAARNGERVGDIRRPNVRRDPRTRLAARARGEQELRGSFLCGCRHDERVFRSG